jgi:hypothetical protein
MSILDGAIPEPDALTRHSIEIRAPRQRVFEAVMALRPAHIWLVRMLFAIRTFSLRRGPSLTLADGFRRLGFVDLGGVPGESWVVGAAGRFWQPSGGLVKLPSPEAFASYSEEGSARTCLAFSVEALPDGGSRLWTETRVQVFGAESHRLFTLYWATIGPFSSLIRKAMLAAVKRSAERGGEVARAA